MQLYGLYKIATTGFLQPSSTRPGMFDFQGRAKYDSWRVLGREVRNETNAKAEYVEIATSLGFSLGSQQSQQTESSIVKQSNKGSVYVSVMSQEESNAAV